MDAPIQNRCPQLRRSAHELIVYLIIGFGFYTYNGVYNAACLAVTILLIAALVIQLGLLRMPDAAEDYPPHILIALGIAGVFALYTLVQAFVTGYYPVWRAFVGWMTFCAFGVTLLPILSRPQRTRRMVLVLSGLAFFAALAGIAQRFAGNWNLAAVNLTEIHNPGFGIFSYENSYGGYAAVLLPLMASPLMLGRFVRTGMRSGQWFLVLTMLVTAVALVVSGARFALLAIVGSFFVFTIFRAPLRVKAGVTAAALLSGGLLTLLSHGRVFGKALSGFDWQQLSHAAVSRLQIIKHSFELMLDKPWFGWGAGMFRYASSSRLGSDNPDPFNTWSHFSNAHNSYLDLLVESGIVGSALVLAVILMLVIPPALIGDRNVSDFRRVMRSQAILALIMLGLTVLSDSLLRAPIIMMHLIIQLGILARSSQHYVYDESETSRSGIRLRSLAPGIAACFVFISLCIAVLAAECAFESRILRVHSQNFPLEQRLEELARIDPNNPQRLTDSADTYRHAALKTRDRRMRERLLGLAAEAASRAVELIPHCGPFHYQYGWILYDRGGVPGAIKELKQAVVLSPASVKFKVDLMLVYIFESKKTDSILQRNQLSLDARELYDAIEREMAGQGRTMQSIRLGGDQMKYLKEFIKIVEKYRQEIQDAPK